MASLAFVVNWLNEGIFVLLYHFSTKNQKQHRFLQKNFLEPIRYIMPKQNSKISCENREFEEQILAF
jgi:hypothetical protein